MQTLRNIISRYMRHVTFLLVAFLLVMILCLQFAHEQKLARETASETFYQIGQLLERNQEELDETKAAYRETCLHNAEAIAYIIEDDPSVLESVEELKQIAKMMEVDEIHIFDTTGRIYAGTHPEYYDYTFDSGEQMNFFKPLLTDKSLHLVQDITPNTAEAKMMQYSALWSKSGAFIVQIGMEPVNVLKATEKNELSYLFSLFRVNPHANYYAVIGSGEIVGSTDLPSVGRQLADIGLDLNTIANGTTAFHAKVNGVNSYCVFREKNGNYIGRVLSCHEMYQSIPPITAALAVCLFTIAFILSHIVTKYMNLYVVEGIRSVNEKLHSITQGNLDEMVDIQNSVEFSELSGYINRMKQRLLDNNKRMSYVLDKANMYIGVYEYNPHMKRVRFTRHVPRILCLEPEEADKLSSDYALFQTFITGLRNDPVDGETNVFSLKDRYVKLEEINKDGEILGVVVDVTEEVKRRRQIETERDYDPLTGLYNRRGLEIRLSALLDRPETLGCYAVVMIDADNLKTINDTYGHDAGDVYLKEIAALFEDFGPKSCVSARLGGDEFLLFLYRYGSEQELTDTVALLSDLQDNSFANLNDQVHVPLRFSFGASLTDQPADYEKLMKEADERMYENKRKRKESGI